jgi:MoaA/NifB/PqqE/SkfB family radical SAM enzyme
MVVGRTEAGVIPMRESSRKGLEPLTFELIQTAAENTRLWMEDSRIRYDIPESVDPRIEFFLKKYIHTINTWKVVGTYKGANVYTVYFPHFPSSVGKREMLARMSEFLLRKPIPNFASLDVTYACQCDCVHCGSALFKSSYCGTGDRKELSKEEFKKLIDECLDLGITNVNMLGGEPLMRPDIYELVEYVDKSKANCSMFTNGYLLTDENVRKLKDAGIFFVNVSLDSPEEDVHDKCRGVKGIFRRALDGIRNALEEGLLVGISTYMTKEAMKKGYLEKSLKLAEQLGVHEITVFDTITSGKYLRRTDLLLSLEEKETIKEISRKYARKPGPPVVSSQSLLNTMDGAKSGGSTSSRQSLIKMAAMYGCFAANMQFAMTAYGDIMPCGFTPLSFGNVREESLRHIWDRMLMHPAFCKKAGSCRMQDPGFRHLYIDPIPEGKSLPIRAY